LANDIPMLSSIPIDELAGLSFSDLREKLMEAVRLAYQVRTEHIGEQVVPELERAILIRTIDTNWIDYLHNIAQLREGIHLRVYGQGDPLQEYKREGYELFEQLLRSIQTESIQLVFKAQALPAGTDIEDIENMIMPGDDQLQEDVTAEQNEERQLA